MASLGIAPGDSIADLVITSRAPDGAVALTGADDLSLPDAEIPVSSVQVGVPGTAAWVETGANFRVALPRAEIVTARVRVGLRCAERTTTL